jgi:hypothetical protein
MLRSRAASVSTPASTSTTSSASDDLHAFAADDLVDVAAEFAVAVVNRKRKDSLRSDRSISRFRACCAIQRPSGLLVLATNSIRRGRARRRRGQLLHR